jgi:hypothetical protein
VGLPTRREPSEELLFAMGQSRRVLNLAGVADWIQDRGENNARVELSATAVIVNRAIKTTMPISCLLQS